MVFAMQRWHEHVNFSIDNFRFLVSKEVASRQIQGYDMTELILFSCNNNCWVTFLSNILIGSEYLNFMVMCISTLNVLSSL